MFSPITLDGYAAAGLTSPSGKSFVFDARADGFVRGEGCGAGVLQSVEAEGNVLVVGTAVRQDGRSASLTAPNGQAQQGLLVAALQDAALSPDNVGVCEAHGTGTALGDPTEAAALAKVHGATTRGSALGVGAAGELGPGETGLREHSHDGRVHGLKGREDHG